MRWTVLFLLALMACGAPPEQRAGTSAPAEAAEAEQAPVYVDVRTAEEFATGHVAGAIHIPHDQMQARWRELEAYRDRPMVVYCRTGRRSGIALEVLRGEGFAKAENGGGFDALAASGVPTAR